MARGPATTVARDDAAGSSGAPGLVRSGAGVGAATLLASVANYGSNVVLGRSLGPDAFADAALIVSALLLLGAVATGFQLTVARTIARGGGGDAARRARRRAAATGLALAAIVGLSAPLLARWFHLAGAAPFVMLAAGSPVLLVAAVGRGVAQGSGAFGAVAGSLAAEGVVRLAATVLAVASGLGVTGVAAALVISFVAAWLPCRAPARERVGTTSPTDHRGVVTATVMLLVGQTAIANGDLWVVKAELPDQAAGYAAIALVGRLVFIAASSVVTVVFPTLAADHDADPNSARRLFRRAVGALVAVGAVATAGSAALAPVVVAAVVGDGYEDAAPLLWPYALATSLFAVGHLIALVDVARGRSGASLVVLLAGTVQTGVLCWRASDGVATVVWLQVALMALLVPAALLAARPTIPVPGRSRARPSAVPGGVVPLPIGPARP